MDKSTHQSHDASTSPQILRGSSRTLSWSQKVSNKLGKNLGQRISLLILLIALAMVIISAFWDAGDFEVAQYPITWFDIATYSLFVLALIVRISSRK